MQYSYKDKDNKIINKNDFLETKQEIIDNYYIETITVLKNTSK